MISEEKIGLIFLSHIFDTRMSPNKVDLGGSGSTTMYTSMEEENKGRKKLFVGSPFVKLFQEGR